MGRYNVAVIGNRKNIIDRMCALIPDYIDYFEEETCRVIRVVGRHTIISWPKSGKAKQIVPLEELNPQNEHEKLYLAAVVDQYDNFLMDADDGKRRLLEMNHRDWLYVFECHM
ncbi:MAG: hypothetical protein MR395_06170 [Caecibacter massiliensis]|uniref:Uncharacterized protein n=1 Tax=Megasphaera hexanoica TaxID=1675036 RepID=A0A848BRA1_9FIRM|nr:MULTISPECIES: hypothetical protein [Megasphaera]MCI5532169.1 hypothetical protein [Caecibacter massiliensis]MDY2903715.1 hypothetical protein [Caecibacter massiliensis]NME27650.1 hypothetical protein [Megasphaera hexanoica]HAM05203.1 hypothetical protein [Megasphaera sp.]